MSLQGKVALVAGATRGAGRGIAVELGAARATVYVTGRTTRDQKSEYGRPETIEETAELVSQAGGRGLAVPVDHLVAEEVRDLINRIRAENGRLDILVNGIWGGEKLFEWNKPVWEHDLQNGLRMLRLAIDTHLITAHYALPLMIERPGGLLVEVKHRNVLAAAGAKLSDVAKFTLYVVDHDKEKFRIIQEEFGPVWRDRKPAWTLAPVPALALEGMLVEIDVIAVVPH